MQWQAMMILDGSSGSESVTAPQLHLASAIGNVPHPLQAEFQAARLARIHGAVLRACGSACARNDNVERESRTNAQCVPLPTTHCARGGGEGDKNGGPFENMNSERDH